MCQFSLQFILCCLVVLHCLRRNAVYHICISASQLFVDLITINNVSKCTTHFRELGWSEVTRETEFQYRILRYHSVVRFDRSIFYLCQCRVDRLSFACLEEINRTFFKLISPCFRCNWFGNNILNMWCRSIVSSKIFFVDL